MFFYGKSGTGKTTLARVIANECEFDFYSFNATSFKVEDLREVLQKYTNTLTKPLIFIDEIHRLSTTRQEVLLPYMENNTAVFIGASTSNPYYTLTSAIRSRSLLFEFCALSDDELLVLLKRAIDELNKQGKQSNDNKSVTIDEKAKKYLLKLSNGDGRELLKLLDFSAKVNSTISIKTLSELKNTYHNEGAKDSQTHYNLISALIKSMRGSDIDASLYYLARLINSGEDCAFIARRLAIFASEDIGNANYNALNIANSTLNIVSKIGYPEAKIVLAQCVVFLSSSPKSNSSYMAIKKAMDYVQNSKELEIPNYLINPKLGYKNPHNFGGWVEQDYIKNQKELKLSFYTSSKIAFLKTLDEWVEKIKSITKPK